MRGAGAGFPRPRRLGRRRRASGSGHVLATRSGSLHAAGNLVDELDSHRRARRHVGRRRPPGRARRLYERGPASATAGGEPYPRATADLHVGLADLDRRGRRPRRRRRTHLRLPAVLGERGPSPRTGTAGPGRMARLHAGARVSTTPRCGCSTRPGAVPAGFLPRCAPHRRDAGAAAHRCRRPRRRRAPGRSSAAVTVDDGADYLREYEQLTLIRLLLASGREPRPGRSTVVAALRLLERLLAAAEARAGTAACVEIRVLQALTPGRRRRRPRAVAALGRAVGEAPEPDQLRAAVPRRGRADAWNCSATPRLLAPTTGHPCACALTALRARTRAQMTTTPAAAGLADPLSEREVQVLRLLDSELTGPRDRRPALRHPQHAAHPHQAHLHQARRHHPQRPPSRPRPGPLSRPRPPAPSAADHHAGHIMW